MSGHAAMLNQHWVDILPPTPPAAVDSWLLPGSIALFILVLLVVALLWQQRPRQCGLRALRRYRRQLRSQTVDARDMAYRIYHAVLHGLALHPLQRHSTANDQEWLAFYRQLQACVFASRPPGREELADLIVRGRYWLKHHAGD
ncbi:MAG: hypothetical protein P8Z75_08215 [Gammaproteobacteria bacterium]|jgi:hypothetical protein